MAGRSGNRRWALILGRRLKLIRRRFGQRNSLIKLALPFLLLFLLAIEFLLPLGKFKIGSCQWIASMFFIRAILPNIPFI